MHFQHFCLLCCVLVFNLLFVVQFFGILFFVFIFCMDGSLCPRGYAGLSQGSLGEYHMMLGAYLFYLPNVSQAGLELVAGGSGSPPVSQCNMA
jgi:hypothetical protein